MNHTVVLDTNALIRLFKGESEEVKRAVMGAARIVIPLAVCAEFKAGVEGDSSGRSREVALFRDFLSVPNTFVHRPTELTAEYYAKIFCYLKKADTPIPTNDIWIAGKRWRSAVGFVPVTATLRMCQCSTGLFATISDFGQWIFKSACHFRL